LIDVQKLRTALAESGYALIPEIFSSDECRSLIGSLEQALQATADEATALRRQNGVLYGARNLIDLFPPVQILWLRDELLQLLRAELGPDVGLVRGLYFDKPAGGNWSLPWHQDLTIAVKDHSLPSAQFRNRTTKAGVPHVEAPRALLEQMLTLRIHLDAVDDENGPLQVLPGSHRLASETDEASQKPVAIHTPAGGVLAIRPLVSHASGSSSPGTTRHRRIIHLEFAASPTLPDGYEWQHFFSPSADCELSRLRSN